MIISRWAKRGMGQLNAELPTQQIDMDQLGAGGQLSYINSIVDSANKKPTSIEQDSMNEVLSTTGLDEGMGTAEGDQPEEEAPPVDAISNLNGDDIDMGTDGSVDVPPPPPPAASAPKRKVWPWVAGGVALLALAATVVVVVSRRRRKG